MPQIEIRDDDGNTVHVNTVTGETTHQPANIFETLVQSAFEVFTTDKQVVRVAGAGPHGVRTFDILPRTPS